MSERNAVVSSLYCHTDPCHMSGERAGFTLTCALFMGKWSKWTMGQTPNTETYKDPLTYVWHIDR